MLGHLLNDFERAFCHLQFVSWFHIYGFFVRPAPGGRNLAVPITLVIGIYNSLYYSTVQAVIQCFSMNSLTTHIKTDYNFQKKTNSVGPIANLKGHYFQPSLPLTGTSTLQR